MARLVLLLVLCGLGTSACGGGDDGGSAPLPIVGSIPEAIAALEEFYGSPQEYFEISARLDSIGFVVAVDDATAAEQGSWTPEDGLVEPEPVGEASGATFTADQIDLESDRIFDRIFAELDDPTIIDLAIQCGPDGTVIYDASIASEAGGVLLVLLGPDGSIRAVQGQ